MIPGAEESTCLEASADGVSKRTRGDLTVARSPLLLKATQVKGGTSISLLQPIPLQVRTRTHASLAPIRISK